MNTDQARSIIAAHDAHDRALANLRNAGAMSTDDPRATEMLESAGEAYAAATLALYAENERAVNPLVEFVPGEQIDPEAPYPPAQPTGSAPGADAPPRAPKFEVGQHVLVDQGIPGQIEEYEWGEIPAVNPDDLGDRDYTEPGYWYTIQPDDRRRKPYRAPEYNLMDPADALSDSETPSEPTPDPDPPKAA